jgi:large subunit ribosomal protein L6
MSKIGKLPIQIPAGVTVDNANNLIVVKGPRGELSTSIRSEVNVTIDGDTITTSIDHVDHKNLRGLSRTLIDNMIIGVTDGYTKKLLIIGV